jgi:hypothetical protein
MKHYYVFIGAPSSASLHRNEGEGDSVWETFTTTTPILDASHFEAASRRISRLYEKVIFAEDDEGDVGGAGENDFLDAEHSSRAAETFITWSSTPARTKDAPKSQVSPGLRESTIEETQETTSYEYSDTSSIGRFPHFSFNLHTLRLVKALVEMAKSSRTKGSLKVNVLMAVLEVEGPDAVTIRKGKDAGGQVSILKVILGDEDGNVLKLTAWRDVAEMWGIGTDTQPPIRRGDIVLFQGSSSFVSRMRRAWPTPIIQTYPLAGTPQAAHLPTSRLLRTRSRQRRFVIARCLRLRETEDCGPTSGSAKAMRLFVK